MPKGHKNFGAICSRASDPKRGVNDHIPDGFHKSTDPYIEIVEEQPWHRAAIMLHAKGYSNAEISDVFSKTPHYVGAMLRQPWAQARLIHETTLAGREDLEDLLRKVGPRIILEVVEMGNSAKSDVVKLAAKKEILNRWLGMPKESIVMTQKPPEEMTDIELKADVNRILNDLSSPTNT